MKAIPRALIIGLAVAAPLLAWAQNSASTEPSLIPASIDTLGPQCDFVKGEFEFKCIPLYIGYLVQVVFGASAGFALIEIIKAGYQIAMGGLTGNKEAGKNRLTWALIGLAVCVLAFVIVDYVVTVLTS